jgi:UDP-GlcNAc3NAcA epimerase
MKVVSVIGARPQFIKAASLSRILRQSHVELLVHTGQHYDYNMADVFFDELKISSPEYHLGIGSNTHGAQTGAMLAAIENIIIKEHPDWVLVYGDTNSTLAGALAAAKLQTPIAHVEAGLRSFNRLMPEEINRVLTDHLSDLLFCPSTTAINNLGYEGINRGVHLVGDVMLDALQYAIDKSTVCEKVVKRLELTKKKYLLATLHRAENTEDFNRLAGILDAFKNCQEKIIFPVHPRTQKVLQKMNYSAPAHVKLIEPVSYMELVCLAKMARKIMTDSGGLQKEAYWLKVPCITLRDETEWIETVTAGWNMITGADPQKILSALSSSYIPKEHPLLYGEVGVSERCVSLMEQYTR